DALSESADVSGALAVVQGPARELEHATRALRAAMDGLAGRGTRERALQSSAFDEGLQALAGALATLRSTLEPLREASPGLDACHARAQEIAARLVRWAGNPGAESTFPPDSAAADHAEGKVDSDPGFSPDDVRWYELSPRGFRLQRTPLDVAGPLRPHRAPSRAAWVFTSPTLPRERARAAWVSSSATRAGGGGFRHSAARLGLEAPTTLLVPSPFDWPRQALCYLPTRMPQPADRDYTWAVIDAVRPVLQASGGRAFLLFASHRALREAAELLREDGEWPLFVQGEAPRHVLRQRFRESGNGVLLGAASFREGVDVAGGALSVVVIDKLPFAAPDDPVFEARLDAIRRAGGNPFRDEQL